MNAVLILFSIRIVVSSYRQALVDCSLRALQLRILLHQLLQAEARKLYSNLGFFAFSFSLVDRSFAIFGMANLLAGPESAPSGGLFDRGFRQGKLLSA